MRCAEAKRPGVLSRGFSHQLTRNADFASVAFNELLCNEQSNSRTDRRTVVKKASNTLGRWFGAMPVPLSEIVNSIPLVGSSTSSTDTDSSPPVGIA